ncbi:metal-dependent transcriptional regulator [Deinococcus deserti]|nr:metal-dependent transcriptional regulator [Deinococcus deserti]
MRLLYLQETAGTHVVSTGRLAQDLNVKDSSVTGMLERLAEAGWVIYMPYRGARLSEQGLCIARDLTCTHDNLIAFLCETLGYSLANAESEAEHLEHHVSPEFIQRLKIWIKQKN